MFSSPAHIIFYDDNSLSIQRLVRAEPSSHTRAALAVMTSSGVFPLGECHLASVPAIFVLRLGVW